MMATLARVLADVRAQRRLYWLTVLLAVTFGAALRSGALQGGLLADDWDHYAMVVGIYPVHRAPLDRFNFVADDGADRNALLRNGRLPWWSEPDIHLAALRPLASVLVNLDYDVLHGQDSPERLHYHSLIWWLLLVAGVAALLSLCLPLPVAALAVLLYSVDDVHSLPVTWAANRSQLVAVCFVVWALHSHIIARTRSRRAHQGVSVLLVALALLAGEHALGPLVYFIAFEWVAGPGSARERWRAVVPVAVLSVLYAAARSALGYGISGSSFYIDPVAEPLRYAGAALTRLPLLLGDLVFGWAAEWHRWGPPWRAPLIDLRLFPANWLTLDNLQHVQAWLGIAALLSVVVSLFLLARTRVHQAHRQVLWLLAGALLSLAPMCGTVPMSRLLVGAAIGFDAALAWAIYALLRTTAQTTSARWRVAGASAIGLIVVAHLVHPAIRSHDEVNAYASHSRVASQWITRAESTKGNLANKHVFIVGAPDWASQFALPFVRNLNRQDMPLSSEVLSAEIASPHLLIRVAPEILDVVVAQPLGSAYRESVYRRETSSFHEGQQVTTVATGMRVTVLAAAGGEPTHLRYSFPRTLDDPSYVFLYSKGDGLQRILLPPVGARVQLPPPAAPRLLEPK